MIIAICTMITFPLMMIPVGMREGTPAGVLVARAYADAYPYSDQEEVLVEDWAIAPVSLEPEIDPGMDPDNPVVDPDNPETDPDNPDLTLSPTPTKAPEKIIDPETGMELIVLGEGETIGETYIDDFEQKEKKYADIMTAQVVQTYDSSDLPIEMLDTSAFTPVEEELYIKTTKTQLKEIPNMDSTTIANIDRSSEVVRIAVGDTWSLIRTADGIEGYVLSASLSKEMVFNEIDRTVWVDANDLKLRSEPNTDSEVIKYLKRWTRLHCSGIAANQWYEVTLDDGTHGYVYVSYTTTKAPPSPTPKPAPKPKSSGGGGGGSSGGGGGSDYTPPKITGVNGESIINIAESMLGVDYDWCGESRSGVDCSGLVVYCYRQVGISVPHQSNSIRYVGAGVSRSDIRLGDVIVYDLKGGDGVADHVAIYAGDGQVIHASSSRDAVVWGNLDMGTILTIRRFIG
ncbi:MAG: C40 family peptidase [Clostridiales bacterium]|nr:C40 family peptidase [Clostridiales bacterium]